MCVCVCACVCVCVCSLAKEDRIGSYIFLKEKLECESSKENGAWQGWLTGVSQSEYLEN